MPRDISSVLVATFGIVVFVVSPLLPSARASFWTPALKTLWVLLGLN